MPASTAAFSRRSAPLGVVPRLAAGAAGAAMGVGRGGPQATRKQSFTERWSGQAAVKGQTGGAIGLLGSHCAPMTRKKNASSVPDPSTDENGLRVQPAYCKPPENHTPALVAVTALAGADATPA